jgi:predicted amidohydrolase YtcJ|tara:strand:- start:886 stop:1140 length:255 start_codon:yes stop_codon:yes gene_type:complete
MTDIITAIVALDPAAQVSVHGDDITWHDGNPNGITTEQITEKQAELVIQVEAEQVAAAEAKSSAIGKLKSLGLNDAEIASITGG